jgi:hypothetical protein
MFSNKTTIYNIKYGIQKINISIKNLALPTLWWEEPNMASILDAVLWLILSVLIPLIERFYC